MFDIKNAITYLLWSFVGIIALILIFGSWFTVAEQERVVITRMGEAERVVGAGFHLKQPWMESVNRIRISIDYVDTGHDAQGKPIRANTYTIDNQEIDALYLVRYRIPDDPAIILNLYKNVPDFKGNLQTLAFDRFKREMGKVNTADFAKHRGIVAEATLENIRDEAKRFYGIDVLDFQIIDVQYTPSFRAAVEAAAVAKQDVVKQEQMRAQAQVAAETVKIDAEGKANAIKATAEGSAIATLTQATADAKAIRLRGEAQAAAIQAQTDALQRGGAALVELKKAENWNGVLPTSIGIGGAIPMIDVKAK